MNYKEQIEIIRAACNDKRIQRKSQDFRYSNKKVSIGYRRKADEEWYTMNKRPTFNFALYKYRVAPENREFMILRESNGSLSAFYPDDIVIVGKDNPPEVIKVKEIHE